MLYKRYFLKTEQDALDLIDIIKQDQRLVITGPVYDVFRDLWEVLTEWEETGKGNRGYNFTTLYDQENWCANMYEDEEDLENE